jgi:hypothetical protein
MQYSFSVQCLQCLHFRVHKSEINLNRLKAFSLDSYCFECQQDTRHTYLFEKDFIQTSEELEKPCWGHFEEYYDEGDSYDAIDGPVKSRKLDCNICVSRTKCVVKKD